MDQDRSGDIFKLIGSTFLGALVQWAFMRMRRLGRPRQVKIDFTGAAMDQLNARFDALDARFEELIATTRFHDERIRSLERRRAAGAD